MVVAKLNSSTRCLINNYWLGLWLWVVTMLVLVKLFVFFCELYKYILFHSTPIGLRFTNDTVMGYSIVSAGSKRLEHGPARLWRETEKIRRGFVGYHPHDQEFITLVKRSQPTMAFIRHDKQKLAVHMMLLKLSSWWFTNSESLWTQHQ